MQEHPAYPHLLAPMTMAGKRLRNRVVHASMTTRMGIDTRVTDRLIQYYANRAAGGAALMITEPLSMARHQDVTYKVRAYDDANLEGLEAHGRRGGVPRLPSARTGAGPRPRAPHARPSRRSDRAHDAAGRPELGRAASARSGRDSQHGRGVRGIVRAPAALRVQRRRDLLRSRPPVSSVPVAVVQSARRRIRRRPRGPHALRRARSSMRFVRHAAPASSSA